MNASIAISLLAFAVSVAGLTVSVLGYVRDRSKLRAWTEIYWQHNGPEPETPVLHLRIANVGRRPVLILNVVKRAGKEKWWRSIRQPAVEGGMISTVEQLEALKKRWLAHDVAVKLGEGEILEILFFPEDCHDFVATHVDPPVEAECLQIQDVSGKLYRVKDSAKNLRTLINAWK